MYAGWKPLWVTCGSKRSHMWLTYICAPTHIRTEVDLGTDQRSHFHYCNQHLCMHQAPRVQVLL